MIVFFSLSIRKTNASGSGRCQSAGRRRDWFTPTHAMGWDWHGRVPQFYADGYTKVFSLQADTVVNGKSALSDANTARWL